MISGRKFFFFGDGIIRSRALPLPLRHPECLTSVQVHLVSFEQRSEGGSNRGCTEISTMVLTVDLCHYFCANFKNVMSNLPGQTNAK